MSTSSSIPKKSVRFTLDTNLNLGWKKRTIKPSSQIKPQAYFITKNLTQHSEGELNALTLLKGRGEWSWRTFVDDAGEPVEGIDPISMVSLFLFTYF